MRLYGWGGGEGGAHLDAVEDGRRERAGETDIGACKEDGGVVARWMVLLPELADLVHAVELCEHVADVGTLDPFGVVVPASAVVDAAVDLVPAAQSPAIRFSGRGARNEAARRGKEALGSRKRRSRQRGKRLSEAGSTRSRSSGQYGGVAGVRKPLHSTQRRAVVISAWSRQQRLVAGTVEAGCNGQPVPA